MPAELAQAPIPASTDPAQPAAGWTPLAAPVSLSDTPVSESESERLTAVHWKGTGAGISGAFKTGLLQIEERIQEIKYICVCIERDGWMCSVRESV